MAGVRVVAVTGARPVGSRVTADRTVAAELLVRAIGVVQASLGAAGRGTAAPLEGKVHREARERMEG